MLEKFCQGTFSLVLHVSLGPGPLGIPTLRVETVVNLEQVELRAKMLWYRPGPQHACAPPGHIGKKSPAWKHPPKADGLAQPPPMAKSSHPFLTLLQVDYSRDFWVSQPGEFSFLELNSSLNLGDSTAAHQS